MHSVTRFESCYPTPPPTPPESPDLSDHIEINGESLQVGSSCLRRAFSTASAVSVLDTSAFNPIIGDQSFLDDLQSVGEKDVILQKLQSKQPPLANFFISDSFHRRPPPEKSGTVLRKHSTRFLRTPDRFLPKRAKIDSSIQAFRASKDLSKLSGAERLLRNDKNSSDAFGDFRRRVTSPDSWTLQSLSQRLPMIRRIGGECESQWLSKKFLNEEGPSTVGFRNTSGSSTGERHV